MSKRARIFRFTPFLVTAALAVGCSGSDGTSPSAAPASTTQTSTPEATGEPASLDDVLAAKRKTEASSGAYTETLEFTLGPMGTMSTTYAGEFDARKRVAEVTLSVDMSSPELQGQLSDSDVDMTEVEIRMRMIGDTSYLTADGWPEHMRGRWMQIDPDAVNAAAAEQGMQVVPQDQKVPSSVLGLIDGADMEVIAPRPYPDGMVFHLSVPAETAVEALGNSALKRMIQNDIDPGDLTGIAVIAVYVDNDGRVARATVDLSDIMLQLIKLNAGEEAAAIPNGAIKATAEVEFSDYGKKVEVEAPPDDKILDPSEMN